LLGIWPARRRRRKTSAPARASAASATSTAGVLLGFAVRYAMQRVTVILQQIPGVRRG